MVMVCSEVRERLVPWHDGELGPSESALIEEHVSNCSQCASIDRRLQASMPQPPTCSPPPDIMARLDAAFDIDALLSAAQQKPRTAQLSVWGRGRLWLGQRTSVPIGAVMVYLLLLAASFAWGVSGRWERSSPDSAALEGTTADIPADQFRPASFEP